jgi:flagellar biosynthesis chaperone FliJ
VFKLAFVLVVIVAGFFIYRTVALQSQAKQAKDESEQLQVQLTQARGDFEKAQASARQLSGETAKLQSQLEQAQGEATTAKAAAEKAAAQVTGLQAVIEQARSEAATAKANALKASDEVRRLQAQLQAQTSAEPQAQGKPATAEPAAAAAPIKPMTANSRQLPVSVTFGKAPIGDGNEVAIKNTSSNPLTVTVKFTDPGATKSKEYRLVIDPGGSKELGSLGAWLLASGDKVEISGAGYDPILKTAP